MDTLQYALDLAAQGIAVFPLKYQTKTPDTRHGFKDATTNPATIKRWFGGDYKRNLAVRTGQASGVWVLDIDDPAAFERIDALPATRQSTTGRGFHLWFKTTAIPIPCSTGRITAGIDVKGENGYVVAPPSVHPDGPVYRWLNDEPIAEAPSWLLVLARKPVERARVATAPPVASGPPGGYGAAALRSEIETLAGTPTGDRNNQLNRASFSLSQLVAGGELAAADVEAALIDAAKANGVWDEDGERQCLATIRSGASAGMQSPRHRGGRA
jgi:hypothetical protein